MDVSNIPEISKELQYHFDYLKKNCDLEYSDHLKYIKYKDHITSELTTEFNYTYIFRYEGKIYILRLLELDFIPENEISDLKYTHNNGNLEDLKKHFNIINYLISCAKDKTNKNSNQDIKDVVKGMLS